MGRDSRKKVSEEQVELKDIPIIWTQKEIVEAYEKYGANLRIRDSSVQYETLRRPFADMMNGNFKKTRAYLDVGSGLGYYFVSKDRLKKYLEAIGEIFMNDKHQCHGDEKKKISKAVLREELKKYIQEKGRQVAEAPCVEIQKMGLCSFLDECRNFQENKGNMEQSRQYVEGIGKSLKDKLEIDKRAAAVIQRIFQMKVDGSSPEQIAKRLNEEGVLSPLEYKRYCDIKLETSFKQQAKSEWSHVTVYRILQNEMYTGTLVQGKSYSVNYKVKTRKLKDKKEWTRTENAHEAIIPPGTFDLVQKLLREDTRSTMGDEKVALFSGKIFCAECHNTMARKRSVISGKEYIYYVCKDSNCKLRVKEQPIYDAVSAVIQSQVAMALDMERALKQLDDVSWERRELERIASGISRQEEVIAHNNQLKSALYEDFKSEMISLEEYRIFKAEFDKNISEAKGAIAHLIANRNQVKNGLTDQQSWLSQFHQYRNIQELTRRVVVYFIDKIEITTEKEVLVML